MTSKPEDHRDIFDKAMDEENYYPVLGSIYGSALGGLLGEVISKKIVKPKKFDRYGRERTHGTSVGTLIGVPVGASLGIAGGQFMADRQKAIDEMTGRKRK